MATLISVHNGEHEIGRCDAKCYMAESPMHECDCVCGGRNHGVGKTKAMQNTREYAEKWIEEYIDRKGIENGKGVVSKEVKQLKLF